MKTCPYCLEQIPADEVTCPLCGHALDPPPFVALAGPRGVPEGLPADLATFYASHEGCGIEDDAERESRDIRLARLDELHRLGPKHISIEAPAWRSFRGLRIGAAAYGDEVCYVLSAPVARAGSIMAFGSDVAGPGGVGSGQAQGSLVLAANFGSWLARLREDGWQEYGLQPGSIPTLPAERGQWLEQHFRALNPAIRW